MDPSPRASNFSSRFQLYKLCVNLRLNNVSKMYHTRSNFFAISVPNVWGMINTLVTQDLQPQTSKACCNSVKETDWCMFHLHTMFGFWVIKTVTRLNWTSKYMYYRLNVTTLLEGRCHCFLETIPPEDSSNKGQRCKFLCPSTTYLGLSLFALLKMWGSAISAQLCKKYWSTVQVFVPQDNLHVLKVGPRWTDQNFISNSLSDFHVSSYNCTAYQCLQF